jgi:hypothetical protein
VREEGRWPFHLSTWGELSRMHRISGTFPVGSFGWGAILLQRAQRHPVKPGRCEQTVSSNKSLLKGTSLWHCSTSQWRVLLIAVVGPISIFIFGVTLTCSGTAWPIFMQVNANLLYFWWLISAGILAYIDAGEAYREFRDIWLSDCNYRVFIFEISVVWSWTLFPILNWLRELPYGSGTWEEWLTRHGNSQTLHELR